MGRNHFNVAPEQIEQSESNVRESRAVDRRFLIAEQAIASRVGDKFRGAKITQVGDRGFHAKLTGQVLATFYPWNGEEA
jgi:hypothetical protein